MTHQPLKFAIFGNIYQTKKSAAIRQVLSCLEELGVGLQFDEEYYEYLKDVQRIDVPCAQVFAGSAFDADFAISMGGDGTFLKTANRVADKQIPILGINMGRLGFLADVTPDDINESLRALCQGNYEVEDRAVIGVSADGRPLGAAPYALNDVAILKRDTAAMISIHATINGEYLTTYQADGIIVSTPTGSTAYSLSNGGPIIVPGTHVLLLTAVAPHSLNVRPIVIPDSAVITFDVESRSHSFLTAIDGRSEKCREETQITLKRAPFTTRVVKRSGNAYFATLREKMMWGADVR
jgi:NAD+ kinase